jgi:hypothetical protein
MKRTVLAIALLAAGPAFAGDIDPIGLESRTAATASRAQVLAELAAAQAADELARGELGVKAAPAPSSKSRAQVVAETRAAIEQGLVAQGEIGDL